MKQIIRWIWAVLALTLTFSLTGCGAEDPYSSSIREASSREGFGQGDRIAVYNIDSDVYVKRFLGERTMAETPEDIGAILGFSKEGGNLNFVLTYAADGKEIDRTTFTQKDAANRQARSDYLDYYVNAVEAWAIDSWHFHEIQILYESKEELTGHKLVEYNPEKERIDYTSSYIPDEMKAESPAEIGAFVLISKLGDGINAPIVVTLRRPGTTMVDFASKRFDGDYYFSDVGNWVAGEASAYFFDRDYRMLLETEEQGGGDKIVAYDQDLDRYSTSGIAEDLLAASPHETALIAKMTEGWTTGSQQYSLFGFGVSGTRVDFDLQTITIELVDAETGELFSETTLCAEYPMSVSQGTTHASARVSFSQIDEWLRPEYGRYLSERGQAAAETP